MSGPVHAQQKSKQKAPLTVEQQQVVNQLNTMQHWAQQPGLTLNQQRSDYAALIEAQQQEDNVRLVQRVEAMLPQTQADAAAAGAPVQELAPAEESGKIIRERNRRTRVAQKHTSVGDHISYGLNERLTAYYATKAGFMNGKWERHATTHQVNPEALRGFLYGRNKAANRQTNREFRAFDTQFYEAYRSGNAARRAPYLRLFTRDILLDDISPDMLRGEALEQNIDTVISVLARRKSLRVMMTDPVNREFFDNMEGPAQELLMHRLTAETSMLERLLRDALAAKGIRMDGSYEPDPQCAIQARNNLEHSFDMFSNALRGTSAILERHLQRELSTARVQTMAEGRERLRIAEEDPTTSGLNLTTFTTPYRLEAISRIRDDIARAPEVYARHKDVLDRLYQEFYRITDTMGDLSHETNSYLVVSTEYKQGHGGYGTLLSGLAHEKSQALIETSHTLQMRLTGLADLIHFYLGTEELTPGAELLAEREGLINEVNAMRTAQQPPAGEA